VFQRLGFGTFEEKESMAKALELDEMIGIQEKLAHVEKSHMPAVLLVPPGMHWVNPKGEGKSTTQNIKWKEYKGAEGKKLASTANSQDKHAAPKTDASKPDPEHESMLTEKKETAPAATKPLASQKPSVLAFHPRGVGRAAHPKAKVLLKKEDDGESKNSTV